MNATDELTGLTLVPGTTRQAGGLAWRIHQGDWQCLLVTSRRTGRWVLPKGTIDPGMDERGTVAQELREEAGIHGAVGACPVGSYRTWKIRPPFYWAIEVAVYPLRIARVQRNWPEQDLRQRRFVTAREAAVLLADPGMATLVTGFAPHFD